MAARFASSEEIVQRVEETVDASKALTLITSLVECLYGPDSDETWNADTLGEIASLLYEHGLVP